MKISKSEMNTNKTSIPHFQGLVNIDEKVIPKLISKMDIFELQKTEAKLILEDQRHAPIENP